MLETNTKPGIVERNRISTFEIHTKIAISGFPCPLSVDVSEYIKELMLSMEEDMVQT